MNRRKEPGRPAPASIPVPLLRAAVERELSAMSLRRAAGEVGVSPNALRNFVRGAEPRIPTRVKLERWIAARPASPPGPSLSAFVRLLEDVAPDLPAREASALGRDVSQLLLDAYRRRHLRPPRWVREVARHYGTPGS